MFFFFFLKVFSVLLIRLSRLSHMTLLGINLEFFCQGKNVVCLYLCLE